MPANLVESLSAAEFADLVSFLLTLKQPPNPSVPRDQKPRH
jgi:hypothetical protein